MFLVAPRFFKNKASVQVPRHELRKFLQEETWNDSEGPRFGFVVRTVSKKGVYSLSIGISCLFTRTWDGDRRR